MSGRESSNNLQRYCKTCGTQIEPGTAYCVACGEPLAGKDGDYKADLRTTDTTRYLCAAAYRDKAFRNGVIEQIVEERYKAVGVSYGIDLATVAKHCLVARRIEVIRNLSIAALSVLWLWLFFLFLASNLFLMLFVTIVVLVVVWLLLFTELWLFDLLVVPYFAKGNFDPESSPLPFGMRLGNHREDKLHDIAREQNGNVVVYSGSRFSPFVGSGLDIGGWSFTVRIDKGKEEFGHGSEPVPFELEDIYDCFSDGLSRFGLEDMLIVADRLYVDGQEIRDDERFLRAPFARPYVHVEPSLVKSFVENPTQSVRYYKCAHVIGWKGQLILSVFVRFTKVKNKLYAEANYFLLPPLNEKYQEVDAVNPTLTLQKSLNRAALAAIKTPILLFVAPILALGQILHPLERWGRQRQIKRSIKDNLTYDYGAVVSVREMAISPTFRRYFQMLDKEMNLKIIERQILDSIIEFLESRNIDTTDLKDRQQTIFNEGVIISGGSIQAESLAMGRGAASQISHLAQGVRQQVLRPKGRNGRGGHVEQQFSK